MNDNIQKGFREEICKLGVGKAALTSLKGAHTKATKYLGSKVWPKVIAGTALAGTAAAVPLVAASALKQKTIRKRKASARRITGQYQPGAGMIAPPQSY